MVSAVTRGIAEADSIGMAANAQAATPISSKRFILRLLPGTPLERGEGGTVEEPASSIKLSRPQNFRSPLARPVRQHGRGR
ncbi:MAG TPA: hypothetical protein VIJ35_02250 [Bradyrhizobium sp.]|jgi:hypothetical protein